MIETEMLTACPLMEYAQVHSQKHKRERGRVVEMKNKSGKELYKNITSDVKKPSSHLLMDPTERGSFGHIIVITIRKIKT